jgi:hypothetical protein
VRGNPSRIKLDRETGQLGMTVNNYGVYSPVPAFGVGLELVPDHVDHNLIADQAACIHDLLGFATQRCLLGDLFSQHVTCGL